MWFGFVRFYLNLFEYFWWCFFGVIFVKLDMDIFGYLFFFLFYGLEWNVYFFFRFFCLNLKDLRLVINGEGLKNLCKMILWDIRLEIFDVLFSYFLVGFLKN